MSSCCHVVMLSCCHVVMLSCCHVVMLSCRHVIMSSCHHHTWYLSFFFSTYTIVRSNYLHTKARRSQQFDFATSSINCNKTDFATKQHKRDLSSHFPWHIFLHISPHDRFFSISTMWRHFSNWHFVMKRSFPHYNRSCGEVSPHSRFFSTGTACGACGKYQVWSSCNLELMCLK